MSECEIPSAWRSLAFRSDKMNELDELFSFRLSLLAFGLHGFFPSLAVEPLYGSHEKWRHQRMTLLGYYEPVRRQRGE